MPKTPEDYEDGVQGMMDDKDDPIEGKVADEGFGPPTYTMFDEGENVRNAFLLNDTFELAAAGAA